MVDHDLNEYFTSSMIHEICNFNSHISFHVFSTKAELIELTCLFEINLELSKRRAKLKIYVIQVGEEY